MKVFSILASAAVLIVMTALVDAQRLLRSEASTVIDSVSTADFSTLSPGSGFTTGNVEAHNNFGALDKEGSTGGPCRAELDAVSVGRALYRIADLDIDTTASNL
ncbi:hypothetical protein DVH05_004579 [Phytophthora capsici]|nr:hypothetical protein DVH05_004579 [Phytophthora capsici]